MANPDAPFGFRPINRDGSPYNGATLRGVIAAGDTTATFIGDAVKTAGTSITGYPTLAQCVAGDPVMGVIIAFEADPVALENTHRLASTQRFCQYAPVDSTYFEVQSDDDTTALLITDVGLNADFVVGSGSTVTGLSGMELDSSGAATTNTLDLQIVALPDREDNDVTLANKNVVVKFNDPQSKPLRLGV